MQRYPRVFGLFACALLALATMLPADPPQKEPPANSPSQAPPAALSDLEIDKKYPLGDQLRVLAEDALSPEYRKLVDRMLITDLAAEWQRVETEDNAGTFLEKHGGKEKVLADPLLKRAYERRLAIREKFLDVMRAGFKRFNQPAPFDSGARAEAAGTTSRAIAGEIPPLEIVLPCDGAAAHWPRFRGPDGQGTSITGSLPTQWSKDSNIAWRAPLPDGGNSSPVIWGERLFITTAAADGTRRTVHCLHRRSGELLWSREVPSHRAEAGSRDKNGYASATPVTDGQRVIVFFGTAGLLCYDFAGNLQWQHPLPDMNTTHGTASSPLLYRDLVIFIHDQNRAPSLCLALDKKTGQLRWRQERAKAMGWATPIVVRAAGRDELLFAGGLKVIAYDPLTGSQLWSLDGPTHEVIPTLVVGTQLVYSASGRNGPTLGLRPGGTGEVTSTHLAWRTVRGGPHVPSPILVNNRLFTVNDTGIASCLDAQTGKMIWQGRIRDQFSASPIAAEGRLYFCGESGVTFLLRAADKFQIVAQNDLGEPILASPAALDGKLFIRTAQAVYCIGAAP
jgi:hypothetical protein